jgi:acetyltransferase-like isoleucine patch superfamily enzyme
MMVVKILSFTINIDYFKNRYRKRSSTAYIKYLRSIGAKIGNHTIIYEPLTATIDTTRPSLIEIGDFVKITKGVTILTHGYEWSVLRNKYGEIIASAGKVIIGNNVFIGMNTTILKSTKIGIT